MSHLTGSGVGKIMKRATKHKCVYSMCSKHKWGVWCGVNAHVKNVPTLIERQRGEVREDR